MRKNNMRTPEEKEKIILEMINGGGGFYTMSKKHKISSSVLSKWYYAYEKNGIEGLKSNTGNKEKNQLYISESQKIRLKNLS